MDIHQNYRWGYPILILVIILQIILDESIQSESIESLFTSFDYQFVLLLALIPGIVYISIVRHSDIGDKEPRGLITINIACGIVLIKLAILIESQLYDLLIVRTDANLATDGSLSSLLGWFIFAFLVVAVTEEGLKFLAFFAINTFHSQNNEPADSVVFMVAIGGGFAIFENVRYVTFFSDHVSIELGFKVAVLRGFTAIPLHLGVGIIMGYFLSKYYYSQNFGVSVNERKKQLYLAFLVPWLIHGLYDGLVFAIYRPNQYWDLIIAILFSIILTVFSWIFVTRLRKEGYLSFTSEN